MKQYNKLVRDKIPQIIKDEGQKPIFHILTEDEYKEELDRKLNEEIMEYLESKSLEEMAEIMEVLYAICKVQGYQIDDLLEKRREKAAKRGGFEQKMYLDVVYGENEAETDS